MATGAVVVPPPTVVPVSDRPLYALLPLPHALIVGGADHEPHSVSTRSRPWSRLPRRKYQGHKEWITCMARSQSHVWTGGMDARLGLWSLSRETLGTPTWLAGHDNSITHLTAHPDQSQVLSTSYDGTARLWSLSASGSARSHTYALHPGDRWTWSEQVLQDSPILGVWAGWNSQHVHGGGNLIVSTKGGGVHVFDMDQSPTAVATSHVPIQRYQAHSGPCSIVHNHDGLVISCGGSDGMIRAFDGRLPPSKGRGVGKCKVIPDGGITQFLPLSSTEWIVCGGGRGTLYRVDPRTWKTRPTQVCRPPTGPVSPGSLVYSMIELPGNRRIAVGWGDGTVSLADMTTESQQFLPSPPSNALRCLAWHQDSLVGCGDDGSLVAWHSLAPHLM